MKHDIVKPMISQPPKMDDVEPWDLGQKPANSKPKGSPRVRQRAPHCSQGIRNASAPGGAVAAHVDVYMRYIERERDV